MIDDLGLRYRVSLSDFFILDPDQMPPLDTWEAKRVLAENLLDKWRDLPADVLADFIDTIEVCECPDSE